MKINRLTLSYALIVFALFFSQAAQASFFASIKNFCESLFFSTNHIEIDLDYHQTQIEHFKNTRNHDKGFPREYFKTLEPKDRFLSLLAWIDYSADRPTYSFLEQFRELKKNRIRFLISPRVSEPELQRNKRNWILKLPEINFDNHLSLVDTILKITHMLAVAELEITENKGLFLPYFYRSSKYKKTLQQKAALSDLRFFSRALSLQQSFAKSDDVNKAVYSYFETEVSMKKIKMGIPQYLSALFGFDFSLTPHYQYTTDGFLRAQEFFSLPDKNFATEERFTQAINRKIKQRQIGVSRIIGFPSTAIIISVFTLVGYAMDPLRGLDLKTAQHVDPLESIQSNENAYDLDIDKIEYFIENTLSIDSLDRKHLISLLSKYRQSSNSIERTRLAAEILLILDQYHH